MMKKMLVLMLVFGLASTASAMTLQISVFNPTTGEYNPDPVDSEITLEPSQELLLDIHNPGVQDEDLYVALVVEPAAGSITGGVVHVPPAGDSTSWFGPGARGNGFPGLQGNEDGPWGSIAFVQVAGTAGIYVDDLLFHCEAPGEAVVRLLSTVDFGTARVHDTLTIHQIPEPMTIALLGLGGLALLRRRK
jgi:hypothetical protein